VVLLDIVIYSIVFIQMFIEWMSWGQKMIKWRQDLMFDQQFRSSQDFSENKIRTNIESIVETIMEEGYDVLEDEQIIAEKMPIDIDESVKNKKDFKINNTIYACVFFAMMKKNKKAFKLTTNDQFELFFKAILICFVQLFFSFCIFFYGKLRFGLNNNTYLQLVLIFCILMLHLGCLGMARGGLYMMKFTLCHPEEFTHPHIAFFMGLV